jgi:hypothetical protein
LFGPVKSCSRRFSPFVQDFKIMVVSVKPAVFATRGLAHHAQLLKVDKCGRDSRHGELQFLAGSSDRDNRLALNQSMHPQGRTGGPPDGLNAFLVVRPSSRPKASMAFSMSS